MRVLMINSVCGIGSTGRICTDIAHVLEKNGHECKVAYGRGHVPEIFHNIAVRIGTDMDVRLHAGLSRIFDSSGFHSARATKKLIAWIMEYSPDLIHLHNLHGYYVDVELLFAFLREYRCPVVWTLHDCWAMTGHCAHFEGVGCLGWQGDCGNCPQKRAYPKSLLLDRSPRNLKRKRAAFSCLEDMTLITPSQWLAELARQSYLNNYPIKVLRNGIDLSVFRPTHSDFQERIGAIGKKIVLGVAGVWTPQKGERDMVRLAQLLGEEYAVVMVGLSKQQIAQYGKDVYGVEKTDSIQELAQIYSASTVFVNLTYEDNYPTVNLEAQACGTPVITYRTGGSVESVHPQCVCERGDVEAVAELIRSGVYKKGVVLSDTEMDKEAAYREYLRLYEELLKNKIKV